MSANTFKYPQPPFTQAIALSGDRTGSKGMFQFAGFAWIYDTKAILVQGDVQSLKTPPEWRQLSRLVNLAHRLRKPIILWNLPVVHIAMEQRKTSLANTQAIQNTELALLKLPHPVISVFDESYDGADPSLGRIWNDGVVIVGSWDTQIPESGKIKIIQQPTEITSAILDLLRRARAIPTSELIANRSTSLYIFAKTEAEFSSKLPSR